MSKLILTLAALLSFSAGFTNCARPTSGKQQPPTQQQAQWQRIHQRMISLVTSKQQYLPPMYYYDLWDTVVAECHCTPKTTFENLVWYSMPTIGGSESFPCGAPAPCLGWWWMSDHIFLADKHVNTRWVVLHEMLHAVLHSGNHTHPLFLRYTYPDEG